MDIGIVNHICGNDWISIQSLMDKQLVNEGPLAEQFIGQHLIKKTIHDLAYAIGCVKERYPMQNWIMLYRKVI